MAAAGTMQREYGIVCASVSRGNWGASLSGAECVRKIPVFARTCHKSRLYEGAGIFGAEEGIVTNYSCERTNFDSLWSGDFASVSNLDREHK